MVDRGALSVVEVVGTSRFLLRAAWWLRQTTGARIRLIEAREPLCGPAALGVLRLERCSLIEPAIAISWHGVEPLEAAECEHLALSSSIFTDLPRFYEWSGSKVPPWRLARLGTPDLERPWILLDDKAQLSTARVTEITGLENPQKHRCSMRIERKDSTVTWLPQPHLVLRLLGQVDAVVAPIGSLYWDALRIGVPVFEHRTNASTCDNALANGLARTVPARLARDRRFWTTLADSLRRNDLSKCNTKAWILASRTSEASLGVGVRPLRRFMKLRRDPAKFWEDSGWARFVGKKNIADFPRAPSTR